MLIYDNGRFSLGSVSFKLPNGIGIDNDNEEINGEGMTLVAPDESFTIQIAFEESNGDTHEVFSHLFDDEVSYKLIGEIEEFNASGLRGYKAVYEDKNTLNEEYALDIDECGEFNLLDIYVMIRKDSATYDEAYKSRIVADILDGIKKK